MVYSYLDFNDTVTKAACLSKQERTELKESEIARADKIFKLNLNRRSRPECLLNGDLLEKFHRRIEIRVQLAATLHVDIDAQNDLLDYETHMFGEELAFFL